MPKQIKVCRFAFLLNFIFLVKIYDLVMWQIIHFYISITTFMFELCIVNVIQFEKLFMKQLYVYPVNVLTTS